jgi:undecaprenyl-diphosphatase
VSQFDRAIVLFLNQFAQRSWTFDQLVTLVATTDIIKGGIVASFLWWAWFKTGPEQKRDREIVVATLAGCAIALFAARYLALTLPHHQRPLADPAIAFLRPFGKMRTGLEHWSAFPSDHAALFLGMATGILRVSRRLGVFTFAYALLVICLARIYLGLHYPTDIFAGAALGIGTVALAVQDGIRRPLARAVLDWPQRRPALFYALFFIVTYQIATLFFGLRTMAAFVFSVLTRS